MRALTDEETKIFFTKLAEYLGANIKFLIEKSDQQHVFRFMNNKVFYLSEKIMKLS